MNTRVRKIVSFISTICLLTASLISLLPGNVYADAQNIQVTTYPATAGQLASYRIAFNVNEPLKAGTDSITCVFPKETNIDSTISSANISVNPRLLNGADFELDYKTGTIKLLNPLRKGDRLTVSYRYEPSATSSQLPRNIKFYDQTYPAGNPRRSNGILDPGEWTYEDRDSDGKISVGDRRLNIINTIPLYRQGSLVEVGDTDFGTTADPTFALTNFSYSNLAFVDKNNDGVFSEHDWLIDDKDGNGYLSTNDKIIVGMFYYPKNSIVTNNDLDNSTTVQSSATTTTIMHAENVIKNAYYDDGEYIYDETGGTVANQVDPGDKRLTWVYALGELYPKGTNVAAGDKDLLMTLVPYQTSPAINEVDRNDVWPLRFYLENRALSTTVQPGDKRLSNIFNSFYLPSALIGSPVVLPGDPDDNQTLFQFAINEKYSSAVIPPATTPVGYGNFDPIYRDLDSSSTVSEFDIRLNNFTIFVDNREVTYTAGSIVRKGELDVGLKLFNFPATTMHSEVGVPNNRFDLGEMIYSAVILSNTSLARRENYFGVVSANYTIGANYPDTGLSLTKGWADVITETLTTYADGGETTFKLTNYPVGKAITPPITDINYNLEPLTLNSGLMRGVGKVYYSITAVNETIGESEPWEERMVEFLSSTTLNAVKIKWSPLQNASKYRIYRTTEAGNYDDNSLVAEILAPQTEYIDMGGNLLPGKPPTTFESTYTTVILTRIDPKTGVSSEIQLHEYELSDYKMDPITGKVDFRKPLKLLDTIVADYDIGVRITDEKILIDTVSGRAKLRYDDILDPDIYGTEKYDIIVKKATSANPDNPTLLVRGVDFEFLDENNNKLAGLEKGMMVFYGQIALTDTVTISYVYRKEVRGDLIKVASGNETTLSTHERGIIPGTDQIFKGRTLSSVPVINVMNSEKGPVVTFTTPVNIKPDSANKINPTPESKRDINITFSMQTGIRNPNRAGNYQLFVRTSKEQTEILSNPYEVIAGEATQKLIKLTQDQSVSSGSSIALTTAVQDDLGNNIPNMTVVYSIVSSPNNEAKLDKTTFVTDASGKAVAMLTTPTTPGDSVVQARLSATNQVVTFRITGLSSQPIGRIVITPGSINVLPNGSVPFTAVAYDSNNNVVPNVKFAWSVSPAGMGTVNENGYFSAGTITGSCDVSADAFGVRGSAKVTITTSTMKVDKVVISPTTASVGINKTFQFLAKAYDATNIEIPNPAFTWTVSPVEIGTISNTGTFNAKTVGSGVIMVSAEGKSAIATITVLPGVSRVMITPDIATMKVNESKQFLATAYDDANVPIANPAVSWAVRPSDMGIITNTGIFTALKKGVAQIVASLDGKEGYATVTISETTNDTEGPIIAVLAPVDGEAVTVNSILVKGTAKDTSGVQLVRVNGISASFDAGTDVFSSMVSLVPGNNAIVITAIDMVGNMSSKTINVILTSPIIIKLQIGNRNAVIVKDGMPNFVSIDIAPFTTSSRTMVPLRFISESFDAKVEWEPDKPATGEGRIYITLVRQNGTKIVLDMHTNSRYIRKTTTPANGLPIEEVVDYPQSEPAPYIVKPQDRTVVPLRFISEAFGSQVDWKADTQEITITFTP
ncbi:hypothetical protein LLG10_07945 [bacterium]|nr:hypothetical protein [bacterium]